MLRSPGRRRPVARKASRRWLCVLCVQNLLAHVSVNGLLSDELLKSLCDAIADNVELVPRIPAPPRPPAYRLGEHHLGGGNRGAYEGGGNRGSTGTVGYFGLVVA